MANRKWRFLEIRLSYGFQRSSNKHAGELRQWNRGLLGGCLGRHLEASMDFGDIWKFPMDGFSPSDAYFPGSEHTSNTPTKIPNHPPIDIPNVLYRLFDKGQWFGSKGRHGWTKMDTFRLRGKHWGDLVYRSKFHGTHQPCPHTGWTWTGHMGSNKSKKTLKHRKSNIPASFGYELFFCVKSKDQNNRNGKIYRFKKWLDWLRLGNPLKSKDWVIDLVLSLPS